MSVKVIDLKRDGSSPKFPVKRVAEHNQHTSCNSCVFWKLSLIPNSSLNLSRQLSSVFVKLTLRHPLAALISTENTNFKADFSVEKHGIIFVHLRSC
ncbi:MAG: hypothetical protein LWW94_09770 [Candidatus Desulfofervidaceae bacterium]|nr:hypothetical protein [Candidatus Desulfofervidaceae bacterium]